MAQATWKGTVLAESNACKIIEGNHYFPPGSLRQEFFKSSSTRTTCPWKGVADYYNIVVDGEVNLDAAWRYANTTTEQAKEFEGYVAFWRGVEIATD
jgi:uncharacterized protein (DUF427 family)